MARAGRRAVRFEQNALHCCELKEGGANSLGLAQASKTAAATLLVWTIEAVPSATACCSPSLPCIAALLHIQICPKEIGVNNR
eukprot:6134003-Amphidinium_carterae.1